MKPYPIFSHASVKGGRAFTSGACPARLADARATLARSVVRSSAHQSIEAIAGEIVTFTISSINFLVRILSKTNNLTNFSNSHCFSPSKHTARGKQSHSPQTQRPRPEQINEEFGLPKENNYYKIAKTIEY